MIPTYKEVIAKTNERVLAPTFTKGIKSSVNYSLRLADVIIVGNNQTVIHNVRLSSAVPSTVQPGAPCKIDFFDPSNPKDMVVAYTY
jgi:hypothetical protein